MRHMVAKGDEDVGVEDIIIIIYFYYCDYYSQASTKPKEQKRAGGVGAEKRSGIKYMGRESWWKNIVGDGDLYKYFYYYHH